jgi:hypothetical protein
MQWKMARGAVKSPELGVSRFTYEPGARMPFGPTQRAGRGLRRRRRLWSRQARPLERPSAASGQAGPSAPQVAGSADLVGACARCRAAAARPKCQCSATTVKYGPVLRHVRSRIRRPETDRRVGRFQQVVDERVTRDWLDRSDDFGDDWHGSAPGLQRGAGSGSARRVDCRDPASRTWIATNTGQTPWIDPGVSWFGSVWLIGPRRSRRLLWSVSSAPTTTRSAQAPRASGCVRDRQRAGNLAGS